MSRHARLGAARVYLIVSPETAGRDWEAAVSAALASGAVDILQLRAKSGSDADIRALATRLREACHGEGVLFVLNDRPDLARAVDADGVHVGEDDASVATARTFMGTDRIVGCSTHDADELRRAGDADYAGLGPCFPTGSKRLARVPGGAALLHRALPGAAPGFPVFPIGGIDADNLPQLIAAGATRAAVGAGILAAADPARAAGRIAALLKAGREGLAPR